MAVKHNGRAVRKSVEKVLKDYDNAKAVAVADALVQTMQHGHKVAPFKSGYFASSITMTTGAAEIEPRPARYSIKPGASRARMAKGVQDARRLVDEFRGKRKFSVLIYSAAFYGRWVEFGRTIQSGPRAGQRTKPANTFRKMSTKLNSLLKKLGQEIRRG